MQCQKVMQGFKKLQSPQNDNESKKQIKINDHGQGQRLKDKRLDLNTYLLSCYVNISGEIISINCPKNTIEQKQKKGEPHVDMLKV